ncbi:MAG: flagellar biosynthesis protein FlgL [Sphingomonadaceae bacterium]|nr:flagellar biosynthesis protein FlgL [Sphingomonadaceae bacterium]
MTITNNSTSAFYGRSMQDIGTLRKQAERLQEQVGSSERLSRSSDDPVAASRLRGLMRAEDMSEINLDNANRAESDLTLADAALSSFADYVIRARQLAVQAGNDTLTDAQRAGIGIEMSQIHGNLVSLANSRDSAGHSLFGGETAGDAYTLDGGGNAVYLGTALPGELALGEGQNVTRGLTGPQFLNYNVGGTPVDLLAEIKALGESLQGAVPDPAAAARDALPNLTAGIDSITTGQTVVGSRLAWIDLTVEQQIELGELRSNEVIDIGATDIASTIAQLQQLMVVLEASQASFVRLSGLSLFEMLR